MYIINKIHCVGFCLFVFIWRVGTALDTPLIQIVPPNGILFRVKDNGYNLVAVHYSINAPLLNVNPGRWNFDITEKTGDVWKHFNPLANVSPGDVVNYWLYAVVSRTGHKEELLNQAFTLKGHSDSSTAAPSLPTILPFIFMYNNFNATTSNTRSDDATTYLNNSFGKTTPDSRTDDDDDATTAYIILATIIGAVLFICVAVIILCIVRRKSKAIVETTKTKNVTDGTTNENRNLSQKTANVQNKYEMHFNTPLPDRSSSPSYDCIDEDNIYDLPLELKGQLKSETKYEMFTQNRDLRNQDAGTYDELSEPPPYLELTG